MSLATPEGLRVAAAALLWEEEGVAKGKMQGKFEMGRGAIQPHQLQKHKK